MQQWLGTASFNLYLRVIVIDQTTPVTREQYLCLIFYGTHLLQMTRMVYTQVVQW